jgi:hypothetical protein
MSPVVTLVGCQRGGDVKNPFAHLSKTEKWAIVIGGSVVVGGVIYWKYSASKKAAASTSPISTAPGGTVTDPTTGQQYTATAVDPATGDTYASEITQYGSVSAAEAEVTSLYGQPSPTQAGVYDTGYASTTAATGTVTTSGTNVYTSNSSWAQAVTAGLTDIGYTSTDVSAALGLYLTGQPVSSAQATIINAGIAEFGPAPTGNLQVILQPTATASTTTTTSKTGPPKTAPFPLNVKYSGGSLDVSFVAVGGANNYQYVFSNGHTAETPVTQGVFSVATVGKSGTVKVRAGNSGGWGPYSSPISFKFPATK